MEELLSFQVPEHKLISQKKQYVEFRPTAQLGSGPVVFNIPASTSQFLDLQSAKLYLKLKITRANGDALGKDDTVAAVNYFLHSIWSQIDVYFNQTLVSSTASYGYKALLDALFLQDKEVSESYLQMAGFYKDTAAFMQTMALEARGNLGYTNRLLLFAKGTVEVEGRLAIDIFQQSKPLLNGVQVEIKMYPQNQDFIICSQQADGFKLTVEEACLKICKLTPAPSLLLAYSELLTNHPAVYTFHKAEVKTCELQAGILYFTQESLFQTDVPSNVICGFVDADAYHGEKTKNPFDFENLELSSLGLYLDEESFPGKPLRLNYEENLFLEGYSTLFDNSGRGAALISRDDYKKGYSLYRFQLADEVPPFRSRANVKLSGTFAKPLPHNTVLIVYSLFPSMLEIDSSRNVLT